MEEQIEELMSLIPGLSYEEAKAMVMESGVADTGPTPRTSTSLPPVGDTPPQANDGWLYESPYSRRKLDPLTQQILYEEGTPVLDVFGKPTGEIRWKPRNEPQPQRVSVNVNTNPQFSGQYAFTTEQVRQLIESRGGRIIDNGIFMEAVFQDGSRYQLDPASTEPDGQVRWNVTPVKPEKPDEANYQLTTLVGPDGLMHRYGIDPKTGKKIYDLGVSDLPSASSRGTPSAFSLSGSSNVDYTGLAERLGLAKGYGFEASDVNAEEPFLMDPETGQGIRFIKEIKKYGNPKQQSGESVSFRPFQYLDPAVVNKPKPLPAAPAINFNPNDPNVQQMVRSGEIYYDTDRGVITRKSPVMFANGGQMMLDDPTAMVNMNTGETEAIAGEAGPEMMSITPTGMGTGMPKPKGGMPGGLASPSASPMSKASSGGGPKPPEGVTLDYPGSNTGWAWNETFGEYQKIEYMPGKTPEEPAMWKATGKFREGPPPALPRGPMGANPMSPMGREAELLAMGLPPFIASEIARGESQRLGPK